MRNICSLGLSAGLLATKGALVPARVVMKITTEIMAANFLNRDNRFPERESPRGLPDINLSVFPLLYFSWR